MAYFMRGACYTPSDGCLPLLQALLLHTYTQFRVHKVWEDGGIAHKLQKGRERFAMITYGFDPEVQPKCREPQQNVI